MIKAVYRQIFSISKLFIMRAKTEYVYNCKFDHCKLETTKQIYIYVYKQTYIYIIYTYIYMLTYTNTQLKKFTI